MDGIFVVVVVDVVVLHRRRRQGWINEDIIIGFLNVKRYFRMRARVLFENLNFFESKKTLLLVASLTSFYQRRFLPKKKIYSDSSFFYSIGYI